MAYKPDIRVGIDWNNDGVVHLTGKSDTIVSSSTPLVLNGSSFFAPDDNSVQKATFSPALGGEYDLIQGTASLIGEYSGDGSFIYTTIRNDEFALNYDPPTGDVYTSLAHQLSPVAGHPVSSISLYMRKVGTPTGTLTLRVETDNAGEPSGELVNYNAEATVDVSTLNTSFANVSFDFNGFFNVRSIYTYWIVLTSDSGVSSTDYAVWGVFYNTNVDNFVLNFNSINDTSVTLQ